MKGVTPKIKKLGVNEIKRYGNLYEKIYSFENLYNAYLKARKNKRYREEVLRFTANLEENLITIQNELVWETYKVGRYREFYVYEPKKRLIMALPFKDRVVQWAIYQVIQPIFDKGFLVHSYACRKGKGTHNAADTVQNWLKEIKRKNEDFYYLKLDISKYFYRVNHEVLLGILGRKIKDESLMKLFEKLVNSEDKNFGLPLWTELGEVELVEGVGMPIGNLTSQLFANIYLNELDSFVKHTLREKRYIRYMDDVIILNESKERLKQILPEIEIFLEDHLQLHLNNKTALRPVKTGICFVGFRIWWSHKRLKKKTFVKMKSRIRYISNSYSKNKIDFHSANQTMQSYFGIMKHFDSHNLRKHIVRDFIFRKKEDK